MSRHLVVVLVVLLISIAGVAQDVSAFNSLEIQRPIAFAELSLDGGDQPGTVGGGGGFLLQLMSSQSKGSNQNAENRQPVVAYYAPENTTPVQPSGVEVAAHSRPQEDGSAVAPNPAQPIPSGMNVVSVRNKHKEDRFFEFDTRPHALLVSTLGLNGAGYSTFSADMGGGVSFEPKNFIVEALADYNTARKTNDGTVDNNKGHIRSLSANVSYRLLNYWFFGTEGGWHELSTTNYTVQGWGMAAGGGKDVLISDTSARLAFTYAPSAFDKRNGSQGFNFYLYIPSPLRQRPVTFY